ncbi:MAG: bifunctional oligoribonuclease/PAP phosphatase NrnA [Spirochaetaceae bacterium]|nr:MAG: bifunctional oligoribonuclease/PAP phosphatase NrnA [Spirochaetaceae bacterium]
MVLKPIIDFINSHDRFILTAHETPDGDAIGSECALSAVIQKMGKKVMIFNSDPIPRKFMFLDPGHTITTLRSNKQLPTDLEEWVLIILDTNDTNNIGKVAQLVLPRVKDFFIIDHHDIEIDIQSGNLVQKNASSTAEILYQIFKKMDVQIEYPASVALFTAIVYDTGSFVYPKTSSLTFRIATEMVEQGVDPNDVYSKVYECNSISSVILQSKVLGTLELVLNNHVAIQVMTKETILDSGGKYEEADQIINIPLKAEAVKVSIFFKEDLEGLMRCSLRSKGNIDVAEIARSFGGGGHKNAAGFKCRESIASIRIQVLDKLQEYFHK